jgi:tetratricopeptide (TPR) repeat protein
VQTVRSDADASGYVGPTVCGRCHEAELSRWKGSDHDRAMEVASATTVLGNFDDVRFEDEGESWHFFRRDGRPFVNAEGPDGQPHDYEVKYTFGVRPLQQYLVDLPGGRLQALTVAWDSRPGSAGGQRWFNLSTERTRPGDPLHWTGDGFTWNRMCADCHSTDLRRGYVVADDRYETRWSEVNVSCEACHGPGSRHVTWAEQGKPASWTNAGLEVALREGSTTWVMNPKTGIAERSGPVDRRELELCSPCHSRRALIAPAAPGAPFLDVHRPSFLDEELYFADGQMKDEVYIYGSFVQSKMHHAGVTCSDCHDPHGLELLAEGNALCARCHLPARFDVSAHTHHPEASPGAQCVSCHMRSVTYMVLDDRHDHSFRIPRPDLTIELGVPNACNDCHRDQTPAWARDAIDRWYESPHRPDHFGRALEAGRRNRDGAQERLAATLADRGVPGIARASAALLLAGDPASRDALARAAADGDPLVRTAVAEAGAGLPVEDRAALLGPLLGDPLRSVRIAAAVALAEVPADRIAAPLREPLARGLAEYRRAQDQSLDQPQAHVNLGLLALAERDADGAERAYRDAIRIGPYFVPAYVNLADLMRMRSEDVAGEQVLRAGLAVVPDNPDLHHSLGLLLARRASYAEAVAELGRAAELAPDRPHLTYVHAVALHSTGEIPAAIAVLEEAHRRHPDDRELLVALTTMERDRGNAAAAVVWARQLLALEPQDQRLHELVAELENRAAASNFGTASPPSPASKPN